MQGKVQFCNPDILNYIRNTISSSSGVEKTLEKYAADNNIPIIKPEISRLLKVLGNILKPHRILEIGTAIGYSSVIMASFIKEGGKIDTIERSDRMIALARSNIKDAGLENVINVIAADALDVLQCLDKEYDLIFIDASKGQYIEFLPHCKRLLKKGGLIIADNVLYRGIVSGSTETVRRNRTIKRNLDEFLNALCNDKSYETVILPAGDGLSLSYKY